MILIVDDENGIREFLVCFLESSGFKVVSASSAEEALVVWHNHAPDIKALITDIVMPGMNGKLLAEKLRDSRPSLPVIFISGYLPEEIAEEALNGIFFKKPFNPIDLIEALRRAIA